MTHTEMTHHFPSSLCVRSKLLFSLKPNSRLTYNTSWFSSSLRCLSNRAKRRPTRIYRNPLSSLQVLRWQTFTRPLDFWTDLCRRSCPELPAPWVESLFRSDKVHPGEGRKGLPSDIHQRVVSKKSLSSVQPRITALCHGWSHLC